ncbi:MAG TPA: hypothetical protein DDY52_00120 [Candidatus Moranbacteria bacterium]|nr:MAG: group 1 glycosyl transferase [Candidatus Moranbacteria bacterium GW2011_GWF1_34_10]HBI16553.1 hypothetical protein [Candidatus Moranbacteria bacterium]
MKILQLNKFYYKKGGSESHFINLVKLLRKNNHEVNVFSTENNKNIEAQIGDCFIDEIEMTLGNFKNGLNLFYNRQAVKTLEKLILNNRPDIVHLHNISHHFSPAILKVFKKAGIPVVMTVHDYKLICPNYKLFNSGGLCKKCVGGNYYQCALNKCVKDSYLASAVMALEAYWTKWKKYYNLVDIFIAPSYFMRNKLMEGGISPKKIKYLNNFLCKSVSQVYNSKEENAKKYILFFGRLSLEKGIDFLIKTFDKIDDKDIVLKIAGEGPAGETLNKLVKKLKLDERVEFLGYKSGQELKKIIAQSEFIVVPSLWYENAPYTILEAYSLKKAVLAAEIGGISELIKENETGQTFSPSNPDDLTDKLNYFLNHSDKYKLFGEQGALFLKNNFDEERYLKKLLEIYKKGISAKLMERL